MSDRAVRMFGVLATIVHRVVDCLFWRHRRPSAAGGAPQPSARRPVDGAGRQAPSALSRPRPQPQSRSTGGTSQTGDPGKADFQAIADDYMAAHPNVKINITVLENEAFKTKLATAMQAGDVPDLFQSWGGGTMAAAGRRRSAQGHHAQTSPPGRTRSTRAPWASTSTTASSTASRGTSAWSASGTTRRCSSRPASPLRRRPGTSSSPPSSKLKDAGITPIAIGRQGQVAGDAPVGLPRRSATAAATPSARWSRRGDWNTDACIKAGKDVLKRSTT